MGAEEPDLYRDTWVRYLGELPHRASGLASGTVHWGWHGGEPGTDRDSEH